MMTVAELAEAIKLMQIGLDAAQEAGLELAAKHMADAAKDMVGTEDPAWPALAESTIDYKERNGYTGRVSGTDPLLRTGQLRASIEYHIDGNRAWVGTDDDVASVHETGNEHVPPRPIFGVIAMREGEKAAQIIGETVAEFLARGR